MWKFVFVCTSEQYEWNDIRMQQELYYNHIRKNATERCAYFMGYSGETTEDNPFKTILKHTNTRLASISLFRYCFCRNIESQNNLASVLFCDILNHDDVIKWKHFPSYWPFVRGIHRWPVNSPHKGQWRGALLFSLICTWINGWVNNRETCDLRRHRTHYDVIVTNIGKRKKCDILSSPKEWSPNYVFYFNYVEIPTCFLY